MLPDRWRFPQMRTLVNFYLTRERANVAYWQLSFSYNIWTFLNSKIEWNLFRPLFRSTWGLHCYLTSNWGGPYLSQSGTNWTLSSSRLLEWGLLKGRGFCRRENVCWPLCFLLLSAFRRWVSPGIFKIQHKSNMLVSHIKVCLRWSLLDGVDRR